VLTRYLDRAILARGFLHWQAVWSNSFAGSPPNHHFKKEHSLWRQAKRLFPDLVALGFLTDAHGVRDAVRMTGFWSCRVQLQRGNSLVLHLTKDALSAIARPGDTHEFALSLLWESAAKTSHLRAHIDESKIYDQQWMSCNAREYVTRVEIEALESDRIVAHKEAIVRQRWALSLSLSAAEWGAHLLLAAGDRAALRDALSVLAELIGRTALAGSPGTAAMGDGVSGKTAVVRAAAVERHAVIAGRLDTGAGLARLVIAAGYAGAAFATAGLLLRRILGDADAAATAAGQSSCAL
jgi:hypothetical protein